MVIAFPSGIRKGCHSANAAFFRRKLVRFRFNCAKNAGRCAFCCWECRNPTHNCSYCVPVGHPQGMPLRERRIFSTEVDAISIGPHEKCEKRKSILCPPGAWPIQPFPPLIQPKSRQLSCGKAGSRSRPYGRSEASGTYDFWVCQIFNPPHNKSFSRILDAPPSDNRQNL